MIQESTGPVRNSTYAEKRVIRPLQEVVFKNDIPPQWLPLQARSSPIMAACLINLPFWSADWQIDQRRSLVSYIHAHVIWNPTQDNTKHGEKFVWRTRLISCSVNTVLLLTNDQLRAEKIILQAWVVVS